MFVLCSSLVNLVPTSPSRSDDDGNNNNNNNNNKTILLFVESMHTVHLEDIKWRSSADFIDFIFTANRNQLTYNTALRI